MTYTDLHYKQNKRKQRTNENANQRTHNVTSTQEPHSPSAHPSSPAKPHRHFLSRHPSHSPIAFSPAIPSTRPFSHSHPSVSRQRNVLHAILQSRAKVAHGRYYAHLNARVRFGLGSLSQGGMVAVEIACASADGA